MKRKLAVIIATGMILSSFSGCGQVNDDVKKDHIAELPDAVEQADSIDLVPLEGMINIKLSDEGILVDGEPVSTDESADVYVANDIVFYLADQGFTYGEGEKEDEHTQEEADAHTVIYITEPGSYAVSGQLSAGQIAIDLGEDAEENPEAVVNLYLNGVDITCEVAPAVIFYNVYECGKKDEETAIKDVDTSAAGANVVIVDDTVNNINGSYVARIYKSYTLSEDGTEVIDNKKLHKYDAAFYSKMSMNVDGGEKDTGVLNIAAENEGLDSELHLTINGGNININSGNDGINTNEDYISVTTVNGGSLAITVNGSTGEGDGIDSNGWLVINGGSVISSACGFSGDAGIDSDMGIHINGGTVLASGNMLDHIAESEQSYVVFMTRASLKGNATYTIKDTEGKAVCEYAPENDFMYLIVSLPDMNSESVYTLWKEETQVAEGSFGSAGMGRPGMGGFGGDFEGGRGPGNFGESGGKRPEMPEGMEPGEWPGGKERPKIPEGMEPGEWPEGKERPQIIQNNNGG